MEEAGHKLAGETWSGCSHRHNSSIKWNRLPRHELLTTETTRQTSSHQEQHKELAGLSSGKWQFGWLAGRWCHQTSDWPNSRGGPSKFSNDQQNRYGPLFYVSEHLPSFYYYFDGYTGKHWPTHDPLWKKMGPTKRKMLLIHMVTFLYEPSSKDSKKLLHTYIFKRWLNF